METVIASPETAADAPVRPSALHALRDGLLRCQIGLEALLSYSLPLISLKNFANVSAFAAVVNRQIFGKSGGGQHHDQQTLKNALSASKYIRTTVAEWFILPPITTYIYVSGYRLVQGSGFSSENISLPTGATTPAEQTG